MWKLSKSMKTCANKMFFKHIPNKAFEGTILSLNPVPSNVLSKQKLNDYLLEILTEWRKKDDIFSDSSLMKYQSNLI